MERTVMFMADERYRYACEYLESKGLKVRLCRDTLEYDGEENIILPLPLTRDGLTFYLPFAEEKRYISTFVDGLSLNCKIFGGAIKQGFAELCDFYNLSLYDYYDDEYANENSVLTAEAAVNIYGKKNALILGYGRIGKHLAKICENATVCARSEKDITDITNKYTFLQYSELYRNIGRFDLIYNTVPACVIDEDTVKQIDGKYIELASEPGGIPLGCEDYIDYYVERGLPARACPQKAGRLLAKRLIKYMKLE